MDIQSLVNNVKSVALNIGEKLTPVLRESKFRETGVLTPEEYVIAGDHLVHHCPTWKWAPASDPSKIRTYLPLDKQYLITRNVPCHKRCKQMEYDENLEKIINESGDSDEFQKIEEEDDSGWVDTHHYEKPKEEQIIDLDDATNLKVHDEIDENEEAIDLDDLMENLEEDGDPNRFIAQPGTTNLFAHGEIEHPRTYDLHICYDKYYQVPRVYLMGYDENRKPLSIEQTYEDFSADHANKTITVETHTSLDCDMPTVHPCKHAEMMKRLITQYSENGKDLGVHEYLLLFLKFVQAVIPTIEYDYTRAIQL